MVQFSHQNLGADNGAPASAILHGWARCTQAAGFEKPGCKATGLLREIRSRRALEKRMGRVAPQRRLNDACFAIGRLGCRSF